VTTVAELKQQLQAVMQLPDDASFYSVEVYEALQPVRAALGRALAAIQEGCSDEVGAELNRLLRLKNSAPRRKHAGTGAGDTSEKTWEAMRVASLAGESQRSLSKRFGVLYNAITRRRWQDHCDGKPPWGTRPARSNVIQFPRRLVDGGQAADQGNP